MKCKSLLGVLTLALSIGMVADVSAFGLPKIGGSGDSSATSNAESIDSVMVQQESLVKTYQSSLKDIVSAQVLLADAHGLKDLAADAKSEEKAMNNGSMDKKQFASVITFTKNASKAISKKRDEEEALSSEGREKYQEALLPYASGIAGMAQLKPELQKFMQSASAQVKNAPMMDKLKVKKKLDVGMYLATKTPDYIASVVSTTKEILTYAKKQGVSEQSTGKLIAAMPLTLE